MLKFLRKYAGVAYILLASLVVVAVVLNSTELPDAMRAFGTLKVGWVWVCAALMCMYLLLRSCTLWYYLRRQGFRIKLVDVIMVTGVGQFYSAITPSSSGGQPMQVLALHRRGIPVSTATAALAVKFLGFQSAFMLLGLGFWLGNWQMVARQLGGMRYLVALGYVVNSALMVGVLLTMVRSHWVNRALGWCVRQLARLRIVKDEQAMQLKAVQMLEEYRAAFKHLIAHPGQALAVLALSCAQIMCLMGVPACLYRGFGLTGWQSGELYTLQLLLFIAAAFVPLPGAAGAQEGGFYLFFQGVFPEGDVLAAMLCWRCFTYYLLLVLGMVAVVADALRGWIVRRRAQGDG